MTPDPVSQHGDAVRVHVRVQPRAARTEFAGMLGEAIKVRLQAPPVDGAANDALLALFADALRVPRRAVRLVSGHAGRAKVVEIDGVTADAVRRAAGLG
ncbi:MAG TPA: DUF167 family protein [Gemmatimonadaceae bacterium]|nr:DUF167 family protein [Gemmatimonadaceae bacterium]